MKIFNFEFYFFKAPTIDTSVLLEDDRIVFNMDYYRDFFRHERVTKFEIVKLKLSDIKAWLGKTPRPINERPVYSYLNARETGAKNSEHYEKLIANLEKGFNPKYMPVVNQENRLRDGQRRTAWLIYTYGGDYEIDVLRIYCASAPLFSKETLFRVLCNLMPITKYRKALRIKCKNYLKKQRFQDS